MATNLFIVFLRRPGKDDGRSDPYWEFGSFGCTSCHTHNLLNPKKVHVKTGDRLAFVQGGGQGCKLLLITPPVTRVEHGKELVEVRWNRNVKPFRYSSEHAPVLAKPGLVNTTLVELGKLVNGANRTTAQAKLASCFRTQCQPLNSKAAEELTVLFERARRAATPFQDFIRSYADALPWHILSPPTFDERRREYQKRVAELAHALVGPSCHTKAQSCNR
jgi:hypothetical protein